MNELRNVSKEKLSQVNGGADNGSSNDGSGNNNDCISQAVCLERCTRGIPGWLCKYICQVTDKPQAP
jgi:hypothetical protein